MIASRRLRGLHLLASRANPSSPRAPVRILGQSRSNTCSSALCTARPFSIEHDAGRIHRARRIHRGEKRRARLDGLTAFEQTVGNTRLLRLRGPSEATGCNIYGKAEYENPGGSIKDRAALWMIQDAEARGVLTRGTKGGGVIVEGTAGNTGIGLALAGQVMRERQTRERTREWYVVCVCVCARARVCVCVSTHTTKRHREREHFHPPVTVRFTTLRPTASVRSRCSGTTLSSCLTTRSHRRRRTTSAGPAPMSWRSPPSPSPTKTTSSMSRRGWRRCSRRREGEADLLVLVRVMVNAHSYL